MTFSQGLCIWLFHKDYGYFTNMRVYFTRTMPMSASGLSGRVPAYLACRFRLMQIYIYEHRLWREVQNGRPSQPRSPLLPIPGLKGTDGHPPSRKYWKILMMNKIKRFIVMCPRFSLLDLNKTNMPISQGLWLWPLVCIGGSVVECSPVMQAAGFVSRWTDADIYERRLWREVPNGWPSQPRSPPPLPGLNGTDGQG